MKILALDFVTEHAEENGSGYYCEYQIVNISNYFITNYDTDTTDGNKDFCFMKKGYTKDRDESCGEDGAGIPLSASSDLLISPFLCESKRERHRLYFDI